MDYSGIIKEMEKAYNTNLSCVNVYEYINNEYYGYKLIEHVQDVGPLLKNARNKKYKNVIWSGRLHMSHLVKNRMNISINIEMNDDLKKLTLVHELMHAIDTIDIGIGTQYNIINNSETRIRNNFKVVYEYRAAYEEFKRFVTVDEVYLCGVLERLHYLNRSDLIEVNDIRTLSYIAGFLGLARIYKNGKPRVHKINETDIDKMIQKYNKLYTILEKYGSERKLSDLMCILNNEQDLMNYI